MNRRPLGTKLSRAILGFQQFKTAEALSPNTLISYECALHLWFSHVGDVDLKEITTSDVLAYRAWRRVEYKPRRLSDREGPLSPKTTRNGGTPPSPLFSNGLALNSTSRTQWRKVPAPRFQRPVAEPGKKEEIGMLNGDIPLECAQDPPALKQPIIAHIIGRDPERTPMQCDASTRRRQAVAAGDCDLCRMQCCAPGVRPAFDAKSLSRAGAVAPRGMVADCVVVTRRSKRVQKMYLSTRAPLRKMTCFPNKMTCLALESPIFYC